MKRKRKMSKGRGGWGREKRRGWGEGGVGGWEPEEEKGDEK